ncbi:MAG: M23 family metallopeptidase [Balneola sp.]
MKYSNLIIITTCILFACTSLPKERYSQFTFKKNTYHQGDSVYIELVNPVAAPVRINLRFDNSDSSLIKLVLPGYGDSTLSYSSQQLDSITAKNLDYFITFGDPITSVTDTTFRYAFPFPKGRSYKIMQGYNGTFSHTSDYSRYAIDFDMSIGDTVTAALDGIVIGVIEDYNVGGSSRKYRPFANYITLFHKDGTMTQYVHLSYKSSFVSVGDTVKKYQPIGLSGNTGFSSRPHLHFNVLTPTKDGINSFPIKFERADGYELKKGGTASH